MTTDRDDASMRRYREASDALGERPSAAARAAILAAAARQVEAGPQPADAPRVMRRPRWPVAAAAAVLLSTLAVMMADRTEQEMPSFTTPAEPAPESIATAPPVTAPPSSENVAPAPAPSPSTQAPPIAQPSTTSKERQEGSSGTAVPTERMEAQRSDTANSTASAPPAGQTPEMAGTESRQASPTGPPRAPAASPRAAPFARSTPAPAAAGAVRAPDLAETPTASSADRIPAPEAGTAKPGASHLDAVRRFEGSAPAWLDRIAKLRIEGRHAEADAELKRFRERYPDVQVPPAARSSAAPGTR